MLIRLEADPGLNSVHGILHCGEVQALVQAHEAAARLQAQRDALLEQARSQAQDIVAGAQQQAMQMLQQGQGQAQQMAQMAQESIRAAMVRAYEEGHRQSAAEWHERHAELLARQAQTTAELNERLAHIVALAVEKIVAVEPRTALYERALKQVQSLTRGASSLSVRVHPDDLEAAQSALARLRQTGALQVDLSSDPSMEPGGCVFESEMGVLDASLDVQLNAMRMALERAVGLAAQEDAAAQMDDDGTQQAPVEYEHGNPGHAEAQSQPDAESAHEALDEHDDHDEHDEHDDHDEYGEQGEHPDHDDSYAHELGENRDGAPGEASA